MRDYVQIRGVKTSSPRDLRTTSSATRSGMLCITGDYRLPKGPRFGIKAYCRRRRRSPGRLADYSTEGRIEFIAEVFAGQWDGRRFRTEVLMLYEKWKGPSR